MKGFKGVTAVLAVIMLAAIALVQADYVTKVYKDSGGDRMVVASGGTLQVNDGATFIQQGRTLADTVVNYDPNAASFKVYISGADTTDVAIGAMLHEPSNGAFLHSIDFTVDDTALVTLSADPAEAAKIWIQCWLD